METQAKSSTTWKTMIATPGNRRRLRMVCALALYSQWSGNGIASYYLNLALNGVGIKSEGQQTLFNGLLQIFNWITSIIAALLIERVGRRRLFLTATAGMCITYMCWTVAAATYAKSATNLDAAGNPINPNKAAGNTVLAAIFIYYLFYSEWPLLDEMAPADIVAPTDIGLNGLLVAYTIEICGTTLRARTLTTMQLGVNIALTFNQYVNPIALEHLQWKYYIVYTYVGFESRVSD